MNQTKRCCRCGEEKETTEFGRQAQHVDGLASRCRPCHRAYYRTYKAARPAKISAWGKEHYARHKNSVTEKNRAWVVANPEKARAYQKAYRERNPEKVRASRHAWEARNRAGAPDRYLRNTHGITLAERDAMFAAQGYRCAICGADKPGGTGRWHTDHDHVTGTVRGVLCHKCNIGIGMLGDSPALLRAALGYLTPEPLRLVKEYR